MARHLTRDTPGSLAAVDRVPHNTRFYTSCKPRYRMKIVMLTHAAENCLACERYNERFARSKADLRSLAKVFD